MFGISEKDYYSLFFLDAKVIKSDVCYGSEKTGINILEYDEIVS